MTKTELDIQSRYMQSTYVRYYRTLTVRQVYVPGQELQEGEELEVDNSTYEMLHRLNVEWPILSFDFMRDGLGQQRTKV